MAFLKTILQYAGLGKKDKMANKDFEPTDILQHRYQDPQILIDYLKKLPEKYTENQITVKVMKDGQLGVSLPRKLKKEEIDGALQAFINAERKRQGNEDE